MECLNQIKAFDIQFKSTKFYYCLETMSDERTALNTKPESKNYTFTNLLSENSLVQTWLALENRSGESCIVKTISSIQELDSNTKNSFLLKSFKAQKNIKTKRIITAKRKTVVKGNLLIEYPYLDSAHWHSITPQFFWESFPDSLIQICFIVDYLHLLDLVHCDLKLDNFILGKKNGRTIINLIDLDFLCPSNTSPMAKIFGSPKHIAPEIIENREIICQTDCYSIGILLKECVGHYENNVISKQIEPTIIRKNIKKLITDLTITNSTSRPAILINSLANHKIISKEKLETLQRTLLAAQLISKYWTEKSQRSKKNKDLQDFLFQKNKIFGLNDEFVTDLNDFLSINPKRFLQILKQLVKESDIVLYDYYWQITVPDNLLTEIYEYANRLIIEGLFPCYDVNKNDDLDFIKNLAQNINEEPQNLPTLMNYLLLKKALTQVDKSKTDFPVVFRMGILNALSRLAVLLGRPKDSITFLKKLLKLPEENEEASLDFLYRLSFLEITRRRFAEAIIWIDQGLERSGRLEQNDFFGDFLRLKAWVIAQEGKHDQSLNILNKVEKLSKIHSFDRLLSKVYHDRGMIFWRQGSYSKSEKFLLRSAALARKGNYNINLAVSYNNLSLLCFEQSDYTNAINYGQLALNVAGEKSDFTILSNVYITLALTHSRLNNARDVLYYLENFRASNAFKNNRLTKQKYYFCQGTAMCNLGDLQTACKAFEIGRRFVHHNDPIRSLAKADFVQAEIALYQGKTTACINHIKRARDFLADLQDKASLAELKLIEILNNESYDIREQSKALLSVYKDLIKSKCYYYSAVALLYLFLGKEEKFAAQALKISKPLRKLIKHNEAPVFRALSKLVICRKQKLRKRKISVVLLKNVFRIIDSSGHKFLALQICRRIADHYLSGMQPRLAAKFLKHAEQIADDLNNKQLKDGIKQQLTSLQSNQDDSYRIQKIILGISEILNDVGDYETAVKKLIQFVVEETAAERGAILMAGSDNPQELRIKFSINCDKASLEDIEKISRSIPAYVSKQLRPLIIEDALNHKRTKHYKSIVIHNIRSVICLPISIRNRNIGVLYLDHHTIPGLFDIGDILFVKSIANFISNVLATIQGYRDIDLSRQQLRNQLEGLGLKKQLVYRSRIMSQLLAKLPEIAKTKASILILGESGTGKELICEMIHRLSLRAKAPLIRLNSTAIVDSLIESELFGVAKKVATDVEPREGKFSAADGGTLFFDEIGDMPLKIQAKVLRAVEDQTFEKVGSNRTVSTDIRYIYATNKNLEEMVAKGKFRKDLYYRINTISIEVPPLRDRTDDIPLLVNHFLETFSPNESQRPVISEGVMYCLLSYEWPGNIRELRNLIEQFCILHKGKKIKIEDLPAPITKAIGAKSDVVLKTRIYELLQKYDWNQSKVSEVIGIPLTTLRRKIKKFNLSK